MPPLLSISIIAFYLSILVSLVIYFQLAKKEERFFNLGGYAIIIPLVISCFLLLNYLGLITIVASLPLFLFGLYLDLKAKKPSLIKLFIANLLSLAVLLLISKQLSLSITIFFLSLALNYTVKPKRYMEILYAITFIAASILAIGKTENILKLSTIVAVSTTGVAFTNIKKVRIKLGRSGVYLLNFILAFVANSIIMKFLR